MTRRALSNAASMQALQNAATPTPPKVALGEIGEAGSRDALARLNEAIEELKALAVEPLIRRSLDALTREDYVAGSKWALEALDQDERCGPAWYLLGIARERAGDFTNSVKAFEAALQLLPNQADVANDLGRLAYRMGMLEQAEKLFQHAILNAPDNPEGVNNRASALRDMGRTAEALEILKAATLANPGSSMLWNTLATIMIEDGDFKNAETFFSEAIRLAPKFAKARYNLGQVKLALGDPEGALEDCEAALKMIVTADDREMMRLARSSYLLAMRRVGEGWDDYEARLSPQFADVTRFFIDRPAWQPGADLKGKTLLVIGEQGLGDELLFANCLPDVARAIGPEGQLRLAVEKRLVPLFQRSFPDAEVTAHATYVWATRPLRAAPNTDHESVDLWAPMASLLREFRRTVESFPDHTGYMKADPKRVAYWKRQLAKAPAGPKVGLLWKSATNKDARHRYFSPFDAWATVLRTPGVSFVNLQYGDCSEELARAAEDFGVTIWNPPKIDLKNDLDDVAALSCALDLVLGFANATFNIASCCGVPSWLVSTPGSWARLGTDEYPWYPQTKVFLPDAFGEWRTAMEPMAEALAEWAKER